MDRVNKILNNDEYKKTMKEITSFEESRIYCRHGLDHLLDVARIMYIYSLENGIGIEKEIIYTTAILHDIGRAEQYRSGKKHAKVGSDMAKKILDDCGFSDAEIDMICVAISEHNGEVSSELSELLKKADKKSRKCFECGARDLCNWDKEKKNMEIEI